MNGINNICFLNIKQIFNNGHFLSTTLHPHLVSLKVYKSAIPMSGCLGSFVLLWDFKQQKQTPTMTLLLPQVATVLHALSSSSLFEKKKSLVRSASISYVAFMATKCHHKETLLAAWPGAGNKSTDLFASNRKLWCCGLNQQEKSIYITTPV